MKIKVVLITLVIAQWSHMYSGFDDLPIVCPASSSALSQKLDLEKASGEFIAGIIEAIPFELLCVDCSTRSIEVAPKELFTLAREEDAIKVIPAQSLLAAIKEANIKLAHIKYGMGNRQIAYWSEIVDGAPTLVVGAVLLRRKNGTLTINSELSREFFRLNTKKVMTICNSSEGVFYIQVVNKSV